MTLARLQILLVSIGVAVGCGGERGEASPTVPSSTSETTAQSACIESVRALTGDEVTPLGFSFESLAPSIFGHSNVVVRRGGNSVATSLAVEVRFLGTDLSYVSSVRNPDYFWNGGKVCKDFVRASVEVDLQGEDGSISGRWSGSVEIYDASLIKIGTEFMVTSRRTPSSFPTTPLGSGTFRVDGADVAGKEARIRLYVTAQGRGGLAFLDVGSQDGRTASFTSSEFLRWSSSP